MTSKNNVNNNNKKNKRNNKPKTDVVVKIEGGKAPGNPKQQGKARAKKQLATKKPRPTNPKPLEDLVRNILSQDNTYVLPRPISTAVAPKRYTGNMEFMPRTSDGLNFKSAMIIRPNPELFMEYTDQVQNDKTVNMSPQNTANYSFLWPTNAMISLDANVPVVGGGLVKTSTAIGGVEGYHLSNSGKALKSGLKYYPGKWVIPNGSAAYFRITNVTNTALSFLAHLGTVSANGGAVIRNSSAAVSIGAGQSANISLNSGTITDFITNAALDKGVWFGVTTTHASTIRVPENFTLSFYFSPSANITLTSGVSWIHKSLWDFLPEENRVVPRAQFMKSNRTVCTGLFFLLQNTTSQLIKGGNIYAARLPGDTHNLPGTVDGLISLITSQTHHTLGSNKLEQGLCWSYTPEKLQDWMFQENPVYDPYSGNPLNLPFLALALTGSVLELGQSVSLNLKVTMSMEYLTTDPSNTMIQPKAIPGYFEALVCELSQVNVLSHNPNHVRNIANAVKRVIGSESFHILLRQLGEAGVKLLPTVLSMIV